MREILKLMNGLKDIETKVELNMDKILTNDVATDIYQITNELMCIVKDKYIEIDNNNSLPFDEYHEFKEWFTRMGWYETEEEMYDNSNEPNSVIRLSIGELYFEYKRKNK